MNFTHLFQTILVRDFTHELEVSMTQVPKLTSEKMLKRTFQE
jgi:hypothetical protein